MSSAVPGAAPNLISMRDQLRLDLRDTGAEKWPDEALERHILRAVAEYTRACPDPQKTALATTAGSRDIAVASLTDLVRVEAVEYPTGHYPRRFAAWQLWQTTLTLLVETAPTAVEPVNVYWGRAHTCTTAATSIPGADIDLVLTGAAGFAAREWASFATNRANVDRAAVERYLELAGEGLRHFHGEITRRPRVARLQQRFLYTSDEQLAGASTVVGP